MQFLMTALAFGALSSSAAATPPSIAADAVVIGYPESPSCSGTQWSVNLEGAAGQCYNRQGLSIFWDK